MEWNIYLTSKVVNQRKKLPEKVRYSLDLLMKEIKVAGPHRSNWKHYGKLKGKTEKYHCHIKTGRPTYVVCWEIKDKTIKIVEVYYAGTHENAPY